MKTYSTEDAATKLNISVVTLRRWIQANKIDFFKIGKLYRFTEDALKPFCNPNAKNNIQDVIFFNKNKKIDVIEPVPKLGKG
ncbi:MAG: hypothetical protein Ta2B_15300 [Termitinemataceae bacterium]|nr:MAG: hypothetical protein Ta2B_15300 [Termitinemataceae bacterium]